MFESLPLCCVVRAAFWVSLGALSCPVILLAVRRILGSKVREEPKRSVPEGWISTVTGRRWFQDLRARVKEVLEAVETAKELSGTVFGGRGAPFELDRRLVNTLKFPDRGIDWRTGLGVEYLGKSAGDRLALELALELAGSEEAVRKLVEDGYHVLPFEVHLEGVEIVSMTGVVVPLGRSEGTPVVTVVGVGRRGTKAITPVDSELFVFGGLTDSRRTFSEALETLDELLPRGCGNHAPDVRRGPRSHHRPGGRARKMDTL